MSYKKYLEYRNNLNSEICIEKYKNKLEENISDIVLKSRPNEIKELINEEDLFYLIEDVYYPYCDRLKIVLKMANLKKIVEERKKFTEWAEKNHNEKCDLIKSMLLLHECNFYSEVPLKDIKKSIEIHSNRCLKKMYELANKIDHVVKNIKWHNHHIKIEAIPPNKGNSLQEVLITIGRDHGKKIVLDIDSYQTKKIEQETIQGSIFYEDCERLLEGIKQKQKPKVINLFLKRSRKEREKMESIKKEIILGIKQYMPKGSVLYEDIKKDEKCDFWKIRTDESKLVKIEENYITTSENAPIKWMERVL